MGVYGVSFQDDFVSDWMLGVRSCPRTLVRDPELPAEDETYKCPEYRDHHSLPAGKQVLGGSESTDIIYSVNPNLSVAGMMPADSGPAFPSHLLVE